MLLKKYLKDLVSSCDEWVLAKVYTKYVLNLVKWLTQDSFYFSSIY